MLPINAHYHCLYGIKSLLREPGLESFSDDFEQNRQAYMKLWRLEGVNER